MNSSDSTDFWSRVMKAANTRAHVEIITHSGTKHTGILNQCGYNFLEVLSSTSQKITIDSNRIESIIIMDNLALMEHRYDATKEIL